jgi:hypothetical protein
MASLVHVSKSFPSRFTGFRHTHPLPQPHQIPHVPIPSFNDNMTHEFIDDQPMEIEALLPPLNSPASVTECFPGAAQTYGVGQTFMEQFDSDVHADRRKANIYYPFASKFDWEIGSWLLRSGLSMALMDEFLTLESVFFDLSYCIIPL